MSNPYSQVDATMAAARQGLITWVSELLVQSGRPLPVVGAVPTTGKGPHFVLLPYQTVLESQAGTPFLPLVPMSPDANRDSIPPAWRLVAKGITSVLIDQFPKRPTKAPGLGPLHPAPPIDELPAPVAAWFREQGSDWANEGRGRLPQISWRQPFSMGVRFAAMVIDPAGEGGEIDDSRLRALGVFAAGVRMERYYRASFPPPAVSTELDGMIQAFAEATPSETAADMLEAVQLTRRDRETAVGLTPHHDLTDIDAATVMRALRQPMQPAVVFAVRLALGAGPVLAGGAIPHLSSVEGVRR